MANKGGSGEGSSEADYRGGFSDLTDYSEFEVCATTTV